MVSFDRARWRYILKVASRRIWAWTNFQFKVPSPAAFVFNALGLGLIRGEIACKFYAHRIHVDVSIPPAIRAW